MSPKSIFLIRIKQGCLDSILNLCIFHIAVGESRSWWCSPRWPLAFIQAEKRCQFFFIVLLVVVAVIVENDGILFGGMIHVSVVIVVAFCNGGYQLRLNESIVCCSSFLFFFVFSPFLFCLGTTTNSRFLVSRLLNRATTKKQSDRLWLLFSWHGRRMTRKKFTEEQLKFKERLTTHVSEFLPLWSPKLSDYFCVSFHDSFVLSWLPFPLASAVNQQVNTEKRLMFPVSDWLKNLQSDIVAIFAVDVVVVCFSKLHCSKTVFSVCTTTTNTTNSPWFWRKAKTKNKATAVPIKLQFQSMKKQTKTVVAHCNNLSFLKPLLSDSNTNVNSMINRSVSLFYRYPLEASHHMVCLYTLYRVCVVCPGTSELVGQHPPSISISASENGNCQPESKQEQENQLNKQHTVQGKKVETVAHHTTSMTGV